MVAGVVFNREVVVLEGDNTITLRQMNMDGTVYHSSNHVTTEYYNDDSISMVDVDSSNIDSDNGMSFLDAMEDNETLDHNRYVRSECTFRVK